MTFTPIKFAIITTFSRFQNRDILIKHLEPLGITWHPIVCVEDTSWDREWIKPFHCQIGNVFDICYAKLNMFIASGLIDDVYYSFLNDDDFYEPGFFKKIRAYSPQESVIIVSMKRGYQGQYDLIAARKNMSEGYVGLEQMIIKGSVLKNLRFDENTHSADGRLAAYIADGARYLDDVFVWFNYLEEGRWEK